jgi:hypothetical protein
MGAFAADKDALGSYAVRPHEPQSSRRSRAMRRLALAAILSFSVGASTGCVLPIYSGDQPTRTQELIYTSEDLRLILEEWQRIWFLDQPSHLSPYRTHGGII